MGPRGFAFAGNDSSDEHKVVRQKPSIFHVPQKAGKRDYLMTGLNPDFVVRYGTHLFFGDMAAVVVGAFLLTGLAKLF